MAPLDGDAPWYEGMLAPWGSGGGKGKGSSGSTAKEDPDTLFSRAWALLIDAIGEGEIAGFADPDPAKCIFLEKVPVKSADGTVNYPSITWDWRSGTANQSSYPGFPAVERGFAVDTEVKFNKPVPVVITDPNVSAVRVIVRVGPFTELDGKTGDLHGSAATIAISVRGNGDTGGQVARIDTIRGKTIGQYERAYRIELPRGRHPWTIDVNRVSPDSDSAKISNKTFFAAYTELIDRRLRYPHVASVALRVPADAFGGRVPDRAYLVKGKIIQVPSNYDPVGRNYAGIWDGTLKWAWSDNPAWVFYDLCTDVRYGIGQHIDVRPMRFDLYRIGQYCDAVDELGRFQGVPDGYGKVEPRFTFNGVFQAQADAWAALQSLAAIFRGMIYHGTGTVVPVADIPVDPKAVAHAANVEGGKFTYSTTPISERPTVCFVRYNDPTNFYRLAVEVVTADDAFDGEMAEYVSSFGWRPVDITSVGCTSRGQAVRLARWMLYEAWYENETATWRSGLEQALHRPGDVIELADPDYVGAENGGRVLAVGPTTAKLDRPLVPDPGQTYDISFIGDDGNRHTRRLLDAVGDDVAWAQPLPVAVSPGNMWVVSASNAQTRLFRVVKNSQVDGRKHQLTALLHYPQKYALVERQISFNLPPVSRFPNLVPPMVEGLTLQRVDFFVNTVPRMKIVASWKPVGGPLERYVLTVRGPDGISSVHSTLQSTYEVMDVAEGTWTISVSAQYINGRRGPAATATIDIFTGLLDGASVSHLEIKGQGNDTEFRGRDVHITWRANFPATGAELGDEPYGAGTGFMNPLFRNFVVKVIDTRTGDVLRVEYPTVNEYIYSYELNFGDNRRLEGTRRQSLGPTRFLEFQVSIQDRRGRETTPARLRVQNRPPPKIIPSVRPGYKVVFIEAPSTSDPDWKGLVVWISQDPAVPWVGVPPTIDTEQRFVAYPNLDFGTWYLRAALYDAFGYDGVDASDPVVFEMRPDLIDITPPQVPTGLKLTSRMEQLDDGRQQWFLRAEIDPVEASDFAGVHWVIAEFNALTNEWSEELFYTTPGLVQEWAAGIKPNTKYRVRARAIDGLDNRSQFCPAVEHTTGRDEVAPGAVAWRVQECGAALRTAFLKWDLPSDSDLARVQIVFDRVNARPNPDNSPSKVLTAQGTGMSHADLEPGTTYHYWIRAVDTSGNFGPWSPVLTLNTGRIGQDDLAVRSISGEFLQFGTVHGDVVQAGTLKGGALAIDTFLPPTITIGQGGVTIGGIAAGSSDPAAGINGGTTLLEPGKIRISGSVTLANWRHGGDTTLINGGVIAANTVRANLMEIGLRGVRFEGFNWTEDGLQLQWSGGLVFWTQDNGFPAITQVIPGWMGYNGQYQYIYWPKGSDRLYATNDVSIMSNPEVVVIGQYASPGVWTVDYGRTIIDQNLIKTGAIQARHLTTGTAVITGTAQIANAIINDAHITNVSALKVTAGTLQAGVVYAGAIQTNQLQAGDIAVNGELRVRAPNDASGAGIYIRSWDGTNGPYIGVWDGDSWRMLEGRINGEYGWWLFDNAGNTIISMNGLGLSVVGELNLNGQAVSTRAIQNQAVTNGAGAAGVTSCAAGIVTTGAAVWVWAEYSAEDFAHVFGSPARAELRRDGILLRSVQWSGKNFDRGGELGNFYIPQRGSGCLLAIDGPPPGFHTYELRLFNTWAGTENCTVLCLEVKR